MAAVTSDITPTSRTRFELLETLAVTNLTPTTTRTRALGVPAWAFACTFIIDVTITGTTPLFDFKVEGAITTVRHGAQLDSTTDVFQFPTNASITQLTTDTSTPTISVEIGPGVPVDTTGSATANSAYAFPTVGLPDYLVYTYTMDGTTGDEDYNGTISVLWHRRK